MRRRVQDHTSPVLLGKRRTAGSLVAAVLALGLCAGPAGAAEREYSLAISPATVAAGMQQTLTVSLTNTSETAYLMSANLTAPDGWNVVSVQPPSWPRATATLNGDTVELRYLAIEPGATKTIDLVAEAPCSGGQSDWVAAAKQSWDYTGTGNDFSLVGQAPATTRNGVCMLQFLLQPPPVLQSGGTFSIMVGAIGGNGNTLNINNQINLSLANPSGGLLGGDLSKTFTNGIATFSNLSLSGPDQKTFTLVAASVLGQGGSGFASFGAGSGSETTATSESIVVHRAVTGCAENQDPCTASSTQGSTSFSLVAPAEPGPANDATTLIIDWNIDASPDCGYILLGTKFLDYNEISPDFAVFDAGARAVIATITFGPDLVQASGIVSANQLEFCYAGPNPFPAKAVPLITLPAGVANALPFDSDGDGTAESFEGLLPDCGTFASNQCVLSKSLNPDGSATIVAKLPEGDPKGIG